MDKEEFIIVIPSAFREKIDLEEELIELLKFGRPRISYLTGGWHCSIEMNTNAKGASFDVKSDFDMDSPSKALLQCRNRAEKAIATIKNS